MRSHLLFFFLLVSVAIEDAVFASEGLQRQDDGVVEVDHGKALTEWFRSKGGYLNENIEFRKYDPNGVGIGMFARLPLTKGETVMRVPQSCLLKPREGHVGDRVAVDWGDGQIYFAYIVAVYRPDDEEQEDSDDDDDGLDGDTNLYDLMWDDRSFEYKVRRSYFEFEALPTQCATVRKLVEEMELGDDSEYSAYVNYLKAQPPGQLPSAWSVQGQELLNYVNGDLPPRGGLTGWLERDWIDTCRGDPKHLQAASLVNQRCWDEVLIPMYDMMSHRNGKWLNTDSDPIREGEAVVVKASRNIEAGEEIYSTYNRCVDCDNRVETYGTPQLFRDYGFVENFPQRWIFPIEYDRPGMTVSFDLDDGDGGDVQLTWNQDPPEEALSWLKNKLARMRTVGETILKERDENVPDNEWETIVKYHAAVQTALGKAVEELSDADEEDEAKSGAGVSGSSGASDVYQPLSIREEIWSDSRPSLCDYKGIYGLNRWKSVERLESQYQKIHFLTMPDHDSNMCFDLDTTVQICEAYRPHYHEMSVHYTAQYIENVDRVLFVGGGDSMLLHEFLKYSSVSKIVGLELDQMVTRGSFKHFGTQPHWNNEKVEWWFGDATKSVLVLPKEYFGSFDMVIVDLSETVMALTVTGDLDIMQALTLLLKPDGVLLKNEINYFPEMSAIFPYTLHMHFYDVPVVCSQSLVVGSRNVDFLRSPTYEHDVEYHLHELLDDGLHKVVHDFQHNETAKSYCRKADSLDTTGEQEKSPGIIMIVDSEEVTISDKEGLQEAVVKALQKEGITVVNNSTLEVRDELVGLVFIFNEGYVIARLLGESNYCGFDIHLWSSFDRQDGIRRSLVEAVGSRVEDDASSTYRIVGK